MSWAYLSLIALFAANLIWLASYLFSQRALKKRYQENRNKTYAPDKRAGKTNKEASVAAILGLLDLPVPFPLEKANQKDPNKNKEQEK